MKKYILSLLLLSFTILSYAQVWDLIAFGFASKIEKLQDEKLKNFFDPLLQSYKGQIVTLKNTRNVYAGYNYKRKDTKREIDSDDLIQYAGRKYIVKDIIYDVEDLFGNGYLFVLEDKLDNSNLYVQRCYRWRIGGLYTAFQELYYSKAFFDQFVSFNRDNFNNSYSYVTEPVNIDEHKYTYLKAAAGKMSANEYNIGLGIVTNRGNVKLDDVCYIFLSNGNKKQFDVETRQEYDVEENRYLYAVLFSLNAQEFEEFTNSSIKDFKIGDFLITDITDYSGKFFQYICLSLKQMEL